MKRFLLIFLSVFLCSSALSADSWGGGYEVGIGGYVHDTMNEANHLTPRLTWTLFESAKTQTRLSLGASFSNPAYDAADRYIDGSLSFSYRVNDTTPLKNYLMRDAAWMAGAEVGFLIPPYSDARLKTYASVSPFILYFGEKMVSVASPLIVYDMSTRTFGWGITLVRITHMMW